MCYEMKGEKVNELICPRMGISKIVLKSVKNTEQIEICVYSYDTKKSQHLRNVP